MGHPQALNANLSFAFQTLPRHIPHTRLFDPDLKVGDAIQTTKTQTLGITTTL